MRKFTRSETGVRKLKPKVEDFLFFNCNSAVYGKVLYLWILLFLCRAWSRNIWKMGIKGKFLGAGGNWMCLFMAINLFLQSFQQILGTLKHTKSCSLFLESFWRVEKSQRYYFCFLPKKPPLISCEITLWFCCLTGSNVFDCCKCDQDSLQFFKTTIMQYFVRGKILLSFFVYMTNARDKTV